MWFGLRYLLGFKEVYESMCWSRDLDVYQEEQVETNNRTKEIELKAQITVQ